MNPFSRTLHEVEVQMKEEVRERRRVPVSQCLQNNFTVGRRHIEQQFQCFHPSLINLFAPRRFVAVAKMQADVANQLLGVGLSNEYFKIFK